MHVGHARGLVDGHCCDGQPGRRVWRCKWSSRGCFAACKGLIERDIAMTMVEEESRVRELRARALELERGGVCKARVY